MIYRIFISYKEGILDPEAEALKKTIANMGFKSMKNLSKGKFFDIEIKNSKNGLDEIKRISKDLLSNPVVENFKIIKK
tara:strand:+ start:312 stop:545 length:234 start_codon:yes stop_codon:yes gene_type:complete